MVILQDYIMKIYCRITLQDYITELSYGIIGWDCITELYYGLIIQSYRDYITELNSTGL